MAGLPPLDQQFSFSTNTIWPRRGISPVVLKNRPWTGCQGVPPDFATAQPLVVSCWHRVQDIFFQKALGCIRPLQFVTSCKLKTILQCQLALSRCTFWAWLTWLLRSDLWTVAMAVVKVIWEFLTPLVINRFHGHRSYRVQATLSKSTNENISSSHGRKFSCFPRSNHCVSKESLIVLIQHATILLRVSKLHSNCKIFKSSHISLCSKSNTKA